MGKVNETFGERVRRKRMEKQITLRKFAEMIDVSPTYISQIERDEFDPPPENRIKVMAEILGDNADELLALTKRVPSDLPAIIQEHPLEVAMFLRTAKGFSREDWQKLTQEIVRNPYGKKGKDQ
jgi:transcriptional regulator with XRE-family HTH domain